jgi:hypothetical protein
MEQMPSFCQLCQHAVYEDDKCEREIVVQLRDLEEVDKLRGHGISCVPKEYQVRFSLSYLT